MKITIHAIHFGDALPPENAACIGVCGRFGQDVFGQDVFVWNETTIVKQSCILHAGFMHEVCIAPAPL